MASESMKGLEDTQAKLGCPTKEKAILLVQFQPDHFQGD
jgi:hypothetical protein